MTRHLSRVEASNQRQGHFLEIVKSTFHKKHPLYKLCNKNTLQIRYCCLPNIKSDISKHNVKILKSNESTPPYGNCRDKPSCPLPWMCASTNVVYKAPVSSTTYTGLNSDFKSRWSPHKTSFKQKYRNSTKLSGYGYILSLKDQNIAYNSRRDFLGRASSYKLQPKQIVTVPVRICMIELIM